MQLLRLTKIGLREPEMSGKHLTFFDRYLKRRPEYTHIVVKEVSFTKQMTIAEYPWGWLVETVSVDDDFVVLIETLTKVKGKDFAILLNRERYGGEYNEMKTYPRDSMYPVGCSISLEKKLSNYA